MPPVGEHMLLHFACSLPDSLTLGFSFESTYLITHGYQLLKQDKESKQTHRKRSPIFVAKQIRCVQGISQETVS